MVPITVLMAAPIAGFQATKNDATKVCLENNATTKMVTNH